MTNPSLVLLLGLGMLFGCAGNRQASIGPRPSPSAEPVAVLITYEPWGTVVGADGPQIVAYNDGTILYRRRRGNDSYEYASVHQLREVQRLAGSEAQRTAFSSAPEHLSLVEATDMPTTVVCLWLRNGRSCKAIYGMGVEEARSSTPIPHALTDIIRPLARYSSRQATTWLPSQLEVMVWPYDHSPDEPARWPDSWPGLDAPSTIQRRENFYSLFLPSSEYERLRSLLNGLGERQAVLIGGKKWSVALRLPLPQESAWMSN